MALKPAFRVTLFLSLLVVAIASAWFFVVPVVLRELLDDPALVRPRTVAVLNPVRDRTPERIADSYFRKLAAGESLSLRPTFGANRAVMEEEERQHPPHAWRLADRRDAGDTTVLRYWVSRRNGYPGEEEAIFEFTRTPTWKLVSYNAVY